MMKSAAFRISLILLVLLDIVFALQTGALSVEQALQLMHTLAEPQNEYIAAPLIGWCTALAQQIAAD